MRRLCEELILLALGNRKSLSRTYSKEEWDLCFDFGVKQAVAGVLWGGVEKLPQEQRPDKDILLNWYALVECIKARNTKTNAQCAELYKMLKDDGLQGCVLKGQAVAQLYDNPHYRTSGDIDMWVVPEKDEGKRHVGRTIDWACGTGKMYYYDYHHADIRLFDTTEVELHYRATISRNPIRDCRLQKWLRNNGRNHVIFNEHVGFAVPDFTLGLILTLNHNLFHLLYEGVGLRQFIDLYYIVKSYQGETHVKKLIRHFKLEDFAASCSWLLWHCFEGEKPSSVLLKTGSPLPLPNEETGRFLLNEILKSGNFGKYDNRLNKNRYSSRMTLMLSWMKHSFRLFHLYPEEVLWTPFGIIRISMWRRMRVLMAFQQWR